LCTTVTWFTGGTMVFMVLTPLLARFYLWENRAWCWSRFKEPPSLDTFRALENAGLTISLGKHSCMARRCKIPSPMKVTFVGYIKGARRRLKKNMDSPKVNRIVVTSKDAQVATANQGDREQAAQMSIAKRTINGRSPTPHALTLQAPEMNCDIWITAGTAKTSTT